MKHNIHEGLPTNHYFPGVHHLQTVIQKMFFLPKRRSLQRQV